MSDVQEAAPVADDPVAENEQAAAEELYNELKPMAELQGRNYIIARMPPAKAALVQDMIDADFPAPVEPPPPAPEPEQQPA